MAVPSRLALLGWLGLRVEPTQIRAELRAGKKADSGAKARELDGGPADGTTEALPSQNLRFSKSGP